MSDDYCAIADYGLIGDCRSAALISRGGSIDWLCWPRFDSPALFGAVLDRKNGGRFRVAPTASFSSTRRYVGRSNVLETVFQTATGRVALTDAMPVADEAVKQRELWPEHELLRCLEGLDGAVEIAVTCEPRFDYGRVRPRMRGQPPHGFIAEYGAAVLLLRSDMPLQVVADGTAVGGRVTIGRGDRCAVALSFTHGSPAVLPSIGQHAYAAIAGSVDWWERWASQCKYDWRYREQVVRSALTLKLLTYAPSGAIVAAPTTSLPEGIGGIRNWDYRYCWLRDASLTLRALMDLGFTIEAECFLSWMLHATALTRPKLQILYDVYGESRVRERPLSHLEGYRQSRPVRVGNDAARQLQLDVYGEVIDAAYEYVSRGGRLDRTTGSVLIDFGHTASDCWTLPDEGIWEPRAGRRHNTHSKAMCWVALDRLIKLKAQGHLAGDCSRFHRVRDEIRMAIEGDGWNAGLRSYVSVLGGGEVDASLLRLSLCGYADPQSERMRSTAARITERLGVNGLLYRYRDGDGLPGDEGAFGICSFWGAECRAREGRQDEAVQWFESLLGYGNDLGLFAEEIDPHTRELLGNFPQGFTHVGLINAAFTLAECAGRPQTQPPSAEKRV